MTNRGPGILLPILFLLLFSLLFLPSWLLQFTLSILFLVILASYLYTQALLHSISVEREILVVKVHAFQSVLLDTTISNRGWLPVSALFYADSSPSLFFLHFPKRLISLKGHTCCSLQSTLKGYRRGIYSAGPVTVSGSDPLGLFPWQREFPATETRIIIYPEILPVALVPGHGSSGGPTPTPDIQYLDRNRYRGMRDYIPGDPLQSINWKASARSTTLQTMEYANTLLAPTLLLLDLDSGKFPVRHCTAWIERTITAAASLVSAFAATGQPIGLMTNGLISEAALHPDTMKPRDRYLQLPPVAGYHQVEQILSLLSAVNPGKGLPEITAALLDPGYSIDRSYHIMIAGPVSADLAVLNLFLRRGCRITWIPPGEQRESFDALRMQHIELMPLTEYGPRLFSDTSGTAVRVTGLGS